MAPRRIDVVVVVVAVASSMEHDLVTLAVALSMKHDLATSARISLAPQARCPKLKPQATSPRPLALSLSPEPKALGPWASAQGP